MIERLLDRQTRLLKYLTSGAAIFETETDASKICINFGMNGRLLHLEARFSHEKRMAKIGWALSRTLDLLGAARNRIIRDFAEANPPVSIGRLENARQFCGFLSARWAGDPPYLPDVAAFELAYAEVHAGEGRGGVISAADTPLGAIRRHPRVVLLRTNYDIRSIVEDQLVAAPPAPRDTRLAITVLPGSADPVVFQLPENIFVLLEGLDRFTDPGLIQDESGIGKLIADLVVRGLIETRH
jgi:hypothetical protein